MSSFDETLVDRIYTAAVVPDLWPQVLSEMSVAADGDGAMLYTINEPDVVAGIASPDIADTFDEFIRDGWAAMNNRPTCLANANSAGFVRDVDVCSLEKLDEDPVYRDFYRKRGMGWSAGTLMKMPSGETIIFSFERAYGKGPVPLEAVWQLDKLRPHLARSSLLSARIGLERARAKADALQSLGLPAAVLRGGGTLSVANKLLEQLIPAQLQDRRDRLYLTNPAADGLFASALAGISHVADQRIVNSIPVAASEDFPPMILHLLPVRGVARDIFSNASALLIITPVDRAVVPTADVLQGLFDLTPAEARVARGIGEAQTVDDLAVLLGSSRETVRSQLKTVLSKTGLSRQQELISLLAGKALYGTL